jgi:hypothetical protein
MLSYRLAVLMLFAAVAAQAQTPPDVSESLATVRNAPTPRRLNDKLHDLQSVLDYGAVCDTTVLRWTPVAIQAGSTQLTVAHGWFDPKDADKLIVIAGAGRNGTNFSTRIASVQSKSQVTLAQPAQASVALNSGYVAYGHDAAPAINAVLAGTSAPKWDLGELRLPRGVCGLGSTLQLPGGRDAGPFGAGQVTLRGEGRGVSWLVALAPMRAVIQEPAGDHNQANLFGIDGSGLAEYGADVQGGRGGHHSGMYYNDNLIAGLHIGTIGVNADGTLVNAKSWYTNIWEFMADHSTIQADTGSVMPKAAPLFGLLNSGGDSHFSDMVIANASVANLRDTGHANNFYTAIHAWGHPRYEYWVQGSVQFANSEVDGATEAGVRVDTDGLVWMGGAMISLDKGSPVGFFFAPTSTGHHSIIGPHIRDIPSGSYLALGNGASLSGSVIQIPGLAEPSGLR